MSGTTSIPETPVADRPAGTPRVRWGAIVWGALFTAFGVAVVTILTSAKRRAVFDAWFGGLGGGGWLIVGLIALGLFVIIVAVLSLVRHRQTAVRARSVRDELL